MTGLFHGVACSICDGTLRYVSSRNCVACAKRRATQWRLSHPEARLAIQKRWREEHPERARLSNLKWRTNNREAWNALNRAHTKARKKTRRLATPLWADRAELVRFYANCPAGKVVDHVIPVKGKTVCGLHVAENLQYLSPTENLKKGNRYG